MWAYSYWHKKKNQGVFGIQTWAISLRRQKIWGQRTKACIVKQSQSQIIRCVLVDHYLSSCFERGFRVVIWRVVHPGKESFYQESGPSWEGSAVEGRLLVNFVFLDFKVVTR
jgi:hypothetical protein